jgi:hypothetical protein
MLTSEAIALVTHGRMTNEIAKYMNIFFMDWLARFLKHENSVPSKNHDQGVFVWFQKKMKF